MTPSPRLIQLLCLGALLWPLAAIAPAGWLPGSVFLGVLFWSCGRDYRRRPRAVEIEVGREVPARFSHGAEHRIRLHLTNRSRGALRLRLRDEVPGILEQLEPIGEVEVPAGGTARLDYPVLARRRGMADFGSLVLRAGYGGGLLQRQMVFSVPATAKVYPRFRGVEDHDLLAVIDRRDEAVRRPRRARGEGTEFESLRAYVPGEDLRRIDWKASARRAQLISRNRQVERGQQVALLIDSGRLMAERIEGHSRLDHSMNAAVMLAHVAGMRGDVLSAACFSNRIESYLPPVRGRAAVPGLMEALFRVEARPVESDYWQVTAQALGLLRRRSLVVLFTDVLDASGSLGLINNLRRAAGRHLVFCVVLADGAVAELARSAPGDEAGAYRKAAACDLLRRRRLALDHMRSRGILTLEASPSRLSIQVVRRYLEIRQEDLQ